MGSKHFSDSELECRCCGQMVSTGMAQSLLDLIDDIREAIGGPVSLSCAYRCPSHNADVGGLPDSQHLLGCAADILVPSNMTVEQVAQIAESLRADGVGRYFSPADNFVHVDTRDGRVDGGYRWNG